MRGERVSWVWSLATARFHFAESKARTHEKPFHPSYLCSSRLPNSSAKCSRCRWQACHRIRKKARLQPVRFNQSGEMRSPNKSPATAPAKLRCILIEHDTNAYGVEMDVIPHVFEGAKISDQPCMIALLKQVPARGVELFKARGEGRL